MARRRRKMYGLGLSPNQRNRAWSVARRSNRGYFSRPSPGMPGRYDVAIGPRGAYTGPGPSMRIRPSNPAAYNRWAKALKRRM